MIIRKLNIFGFGQHENLTIEFTNGINVLYGLNEAGKTTIHQFILQILFGFPARNQQFLRYEPKTGSKYGGQVHIETESDGYVIIERVKGKASGDVTVHFENGRRGGEEELRKILHQYDRQSFESVFSFSLLQLQGFEKMDEMELSRTLLASGTTGVDSLTQLEKRMQKEMENLFKPSGKRPEINRTIDELRELEVVLKDARKQMDEYAPAIQRISEIELEMGALVEEENRLRNEQANFILFRQTAPLLKKRQAIQYQLERYQDITFPAEGIRRMESLENRLLDEKTAIARLHEEINVKMKDVDRSALYEEIDCLQDLLARESEWHQWRSIEKDLSVKVKKFKKDVHRLQSELGLKDLKKCSSADLSLAQEETLLSLASEYKLVEEQIGFLRRQIEELHSEQQENDGTLKSLNEQLSAREMETAAQWPNLQRKISEAKAYMALAKGSYANNRAKLSILTMVIAIAGASFGAIASNWPLFLLSTVLLMGSLIFFVTAGKKEAPAEVKKMHSLLKQYAGKEEELDHLYNTWRRMTDERERALTESEKIQRKVDSFTKNHMEARQKLNSIEQQIEAFAEQYALIPMPSILLLPELFKMMRELQSIHFELLDSERELLNVRGRIERRYEEALAILHADFLPEEELYGAIRKRYSEQLQLKAMVEQAEANLSEQQQRLNEKEQIVAALLEEQVHLAKEAKAETIEQFYDTYQKHKEKEDLQREFIQLEAQLDGVGPIEVTAEVEVEIDGKFERNEERLTAIRQLKENLQTEKIRLEHLTDGLLNDETYGLKLQEFEMKKAELAELAKKWAIYKSVSEGIQQMLRHLKEDKLPAVLNRAQSTFARLSTNRYTSLEVNELGMFEAVSSNGMRYSIAELSQATKEQAYIALRFALAESLQSSVSFPIIMDDPFVHFDRTRLQQMVKLMSEMQQHHQFLYFTCHDEMTSVWEDATVILVNREKGAISI